ncbi:hypothetical protein [Acidianus sp. HS-5]|uniref:protein UpsX n=1 Tax=Acidianus sp. HS-5 TaxID=2886040 RepID=UPI001F44F981|nr:hypothetical protein [Acidianus sp. HS-5]BDC19043.1 hypothetical protein HS5_19330 [Acidianus sp. HS-5]
MKIPIYKYISKLTIPEGLNYTLENIEDVIYLKTDSVKQPEITLFPKVNISKDPWIIQRGNKLIQINGKEEVLEEVTEDALSIIYVNVEGVFEKILQKKENEYTFKGNKYSKLVKFFNTHVLENNKKIILIYEKMEINRDKPKFYSINKNGISLIYDGYTEIISKFGSFRTNEERIFLGKISGKSVFQSLDGKIMEEDDVIGYCEDRAELLGSTSFGIVIACNGKVKYFNDGIWQELETNVDPLLSFVNSNFIILTSSSFTLVYDKNLFLLYKFSSSVGSATSRYIVLFRSPFAGVIDTLDREEIFKTEKNILDVSSPIKIFIMKNYNVEYQNVVEINRRDINSKYYEVEVEPKILGDDDAKFRLISPFFSLNVNIPIVSEKPKLYVKGSIIRTNGEVLGTKMNSYLNISINTKVVTNLPYTIRIKFRDKFFDYNFDKKEINTNYKIPINIFDKKESNEVIKLEIIRNDIVQNTLELLIPIIFVEPGKDWKSEIVDRGDYIEKILHTEKGDISWTKVYHLPKRRKAIVVKENSKEGVKTLRNKVVINLEKPIESLYYAINYPYLVLIPKMRYYYPIEVFYGTSSYRGLPEKIFFPLDPAYNEIFIRVYLGSKIIKTKYKIPKDAYLRIAINAKKSLEEFLKSFGLV